MLTGRAADGGNLENWAPAFAYRAHFAGPYPNQLCVNLLYNMAWFVLWTCYLNLAVGVPPKP